MSCVADPRHFHADPDPDHAFHFYTDPDPALQVSKLIILLSLVKVLSYDFAGFKFQKVNIIGRLEF